MHLSLFKGGLPLTCFSPPPHAPCTLLYTKARFLFLLTLYSTCILTRPSFLIHTTCTTTLKSVFDQWPPGGGFPPGGAVLPLMIEGATSAGSGQVAGLQVSIWCSNLALILQFIEDRDKMAIFYSWCRDLIAMTF